MRKSHAIGQKHWPCMKKCAHLKRTGKGEFSYYGAIRKFSNVHLLKNSNQMLTAQRNGRLLLPLYSLRLCRGTALEPEISKALHKTHLSLAQLGDRRDATHPPPVRGINFKQDARLKSK